jgi:hypothetical protein
MSSSFFEGDVIDARNGFALIAPQQRRCRSKKPIDETQQNIAAAGFLAGRYIAYR